MEDVNGSVGSVATGTKIRKARKAKEVTPQRGRPVKYFGALAAYIVSLVRKHGQQYAFNILNADSKSKNGKKLLALRNLETVPKALGISKPTMQKLCDNAPKPVQLSKGRPTFKHVAKFEAVVQTANEKASEPAKAA